MKHLLILLAAIFCINVAAVPDDRQSRHDAAMTLVQSTKVPNINISGREDYLINILDCAIQLDPNLWEAYEEKGTILALSHRTKEALALFQQLEREGRFSSNSNLFCRLGDYYYCTNDTTRGREKFLKAQKKEEAAFAQLPSDPIVGKVAFIYRRLYGQQEALKKCNALLKKSPITSQEARDKALQEVRLWTEIPESMIGPCPTFETQPIGQQRIYTRTTDRIDMSNLESNVQKLFQE
ncbi:tetratricopeptide repeat protein [Alloprevotella sp. oral taxon 473]|uniref:tetratricopeptide repeat protein n=1 Tax=Alloprevotella sp. oral taxon 473 TaxID=712469 RepID=UPI0002A32E4F|nr:hypothetical protein [Alloprevotella sp. oral taxon 473]EKX94503.1 hypothetical protein HMPREF9999_00006 [Alloprevotella sp. oral taxon 473 str. F0040]